MALTRAGMPVVGRTNRRRVTPQKSTIKASKVAATTLQRLRIRNLPTRRRAAVFSVMFTPSLGAQSSLVPGRARTPPTRA